jgi:hypothetical protein
MGDVTVESLLALLGDIKRLADLPPIVLRAGVLTPVRKVLSKPERVCAVRR